MKSKTVIVSLIIVVVIAGGAFALAPRSSKNQTLPAQQTISPLSDVPTQSPEPALTMPPTASPAESPALAAREILVVARQYAFEPSVIRVKKGERVRLTLASVDVEHGIAIPELGVDITAVQGKSASGEFTASKTGTFDFYCSVFCGSGHGDMKGQLIVE